MSSAEYFNSIANKWNVIREEYFDDKLKKLVIDEENIKGKICADLGCGAGFISLALAEKARIVFSLDQSKNMLRELNKDAKKKGYKNVFPIHGNMENIPFFDDSMDFVYTNMALHHIESPEKTIQESFRILKKEGKVVISDVEKHDGEWAKSEMHDVWLGFTDEQIIDWLEKAGFEEIVIQRAGLSCQGYSSQGESTKAGIFIARATKTSK